MKPWNNPGNREHARPCICPWEYEKWELFPSALKININKEKNKVEEREEKVDKKKVENMFSCFMAFS